MLVATIFVAEKGVLSHFAQVATKMLQLVQFVGYSGCTNNLSDIHLAGFYK